MTTSYNGVTLPYALSTSFSQSPVYDESNTDWYCTEFDITVQTVLSLPYLGIVAPDYVAAVNTSGAPPINSAAEMMNYVRQLLSQPRKKLSYVFNGVDLIPAQTGGPGTVDVDNGPKIKFLKCTLLTEVTFLVQFRVVARYWEAINPANGEFNVGDGLAIPNVAGNPVLYNRWTEVVTMDDCMFTTRTREGKFRIRSDNDLGVIPDNVRSQMAVVGVPSGFIRESARYTQTPDGLGLQYSIVDKEQFKPPPLGAYRADGYYSEAVGPLAAVRYGQVVVRLKGGNFHSSSAAPGGLGGIAPITPGTQAALVNIAMKVAAQKLVLRGATFGAITKGNPNQLSLIMHCSVRVGLFENTVEVDMKVQFTPQKGRIQGVSIGDPSMTQTPGSDPGQGNSGPTYFDRGTAGLVLQAAKYYDPSIPNTALAPQPSLGSNDNPPTTNDNANLSTGLFPGQAGAFLE